MSLLSIRASRRAKYILLRSQPSRFIVNVLLNFLNLRALNSILTEILVLGFCQSFFFIMKHHFYMFSLCHTVTYVITHLYRIYEISVMKENYRNSNKSTTMFGSCHLKRVTHTFLSGKVSATVILPIEIAGNTD